MSKQELRGWGAGFSVHYIFDMVSSSVLSFVVLGSYVIIFPILSLGKWAPYVISSGESMVLCKKMDKKSSGGRGRRFYSLHFGHGSASTNFVS